MVASCGVGGGGGDCLIKLFGKTIPVPEAADTAKVSHSGKENSKFTTVSRQTSTTAGADQTYTNLSVSFQESGSSSDISSSTESDAPDAENQHQAASDPSPQPEVVDADDPKSSPETTTPQRPGGDVASQREKLKKPDKVLPCPRCNSMDTKFCYFNNYNVNQPRHFCKNCQRYWTAGGAMRNVPVGAGRRKNKHAVASHHFLHSLRTAGDHPLKTTTNGTVLSFGAMAPPAMQEVTEQVSNLKEKLLTISPRKNAMQGPCSEGSSSTDDKWSSSSTVDKPASRVQHHPAGGSMNNAWPYSCAPSPAAAYFSSRIAIPIYPAAPGYWGCMVPGAWSLPWPVQQPLPQPQGQGISSTTAPSVSSSEHDESLTLGKHPREVDEGRTSAGHGNGGKVWAPKTIRIDDADEVARSSIWSLIGIKAAGDTKNQDDADHDGGHKHGTVFEPKSEGKKTAMITSSPLLHVNPVALTRSVTFHEAS
ncbi:hypothetical protein HU200_023733 [Digitaria exilis]|uniref:Dof-type domain-containing protein n=1 Tax=Digitaria exilis TaxID=1010633 RepID=A0A835C418_9POAL|nr:hypothetical protein HU200_023733 [Digitaria exilis]